MSTIYIREADRSDFVPIMAIIQQAKELLHSDGSPQWQSGSPDGEMILNDIMQGNCLLLIVGGSVAGTAALVTEPDPAYRTIFAGQWQNTSAPYATIHRLALAEDFRGQHLANFFISNLISRAYSLGFRHLRIDTHEKMSGPKAWFSAVVLNTGDKCRLMPARMVNAVPTSFTWSRDVHVAR